MENSDRPSAKIGFPGTDEVLIDLTILEREFRKRALARGTFREAIKEDRKILRRTGESRGRSRSDR